MIVSLTMAMMVSVSAAVVADRFMPGVDPLGAAIVAGIATAYITIVDYLFPLGRSTVDIVSKVATRMAGEVRDGAAANEGWYMRIALTVVMILALEAVIAHVVPSAR